GYDVIGIDISDAAVKACRKLYGERMRAICASADSIPLDGGSVDGIVMIHILEHLTDIELRGAVKEAYRVLKRGGKVFVRVFHTDDMRSDKGERIDRRTVVRGNGIMYRYFDEDDVKGAFGEFTGITMERVDETTKFKETRSRIEAIFEKPA
ncbi:MAG: class I SAM-dependent methyltransferase, partial [Methanomassiliicoccaceae archaeon]|nr:class I SAM-dependent methyltransferase [Methanomassiliicoccaceae archaeon]